MKSVSSREFYTWMVLVFLALIVIQIDMYAGLSYDWTMSAKLVVAIGALLIAAFRFSKAKQPE